jgi:hypothetical protein
MLPFALFGIVLLLLLLLSWFLLLPRFTRIELHGTPQDLNRLQAYSREVQTELQRVENKRLALILPLSESPYGLLVREKMRQPHLLELYEQLQNIAKSFLPEQPRAVILEAIRFKGGMVELQGDVRNVGLMSMAVLAEFTDAVKAMPGVERVDFPTFTREKDPAVGFHSPFVLRFSLK